MYVQAADGRFYRNPTFEGHRYLFQATDDGCFVKREGRVTWPTVRRPLHSDGLHTRLDSVYEDSTAIIADRLVKVSVFKVNLKNRMPIPQIFEGVLSFKPTPQELDGETVLSFNEQ